MTGEVTFAEFVTREGVPWPPDDSDGPRHELYGEVEPPALARAYAPAIETEQPDDEPQAGVLTAWWNDHRKDEFVNEPDDNSTTVEAPAQDATGGGDWAQWQAGRDRRLEHLVRTEIPNDPK